MHVKYTYQPPTKAPEPKPPVSVDATPPNPRESLHKDQLDVVALIMAKTGLPEPKALALVVALSDSGALKRYLSGGYHNPGRATEYDQEALSLDAIDAHLKKQYPNLVCKDVAAQIHLCQAYYFVTNSDSGAVSAMLEQHWRGDFLDKVKLLRTRFGEKFIKSSGAGEVMDYVVDRAPLYADKSAGSRLFQICFASDIAATILHKIRTNPACLEDLAEDAREQLLVLLAEEETLVGVAYNLPSPLTIEKVIILTQKTKAAQDVPADHTVIHLVHTLDDVPSDEVLRRYEVFAVASPPDDFTFMGYHRVGYKNIVGVTVEDGVEREVTHKAHIYARDNVDLVRHHLYMSAAIANIIHGFTRCPVSKQSFSYRNGAAYRSEIQRALVRYNLLPSGSVTLQPKSAKATKAKKSKASASQGSKPASVAGESIVSDATTATAVSEVKPTTTSATAKTAQDTSTNWYDEAFVQPPDLTTLGSSMLLEGGIPGMCLTDKHSTKSILAALPEYIQFVTRLSIDGKCIPVQSALAMTEDIESSFAPFFNFIVSRLTPKKNATKISDTIDALFKDFSRSPRQAKGIVDGVCKLQSRTYRGNEWELWLLRIVSVVVISCIKDRGIEPYVEAYVMWARPAIQKTNNKKPSQPSKKQQRGGGNGRAPQKPQPAWTSKKQ